MFCRNWLVWWENSRHCPELSHAHRKMKRKFAYTMRRSPSQTRRGFLELFWKMTLFVPRKWQKISYKHHREKCSENMESGFKIFRKFTCCRSKVSTHCGPFFPLIILAPLCVFIFMETSQTTQLTPSPPHRFKSISTRVAKRVLRPRDEKKRVFLLFRSPLPLQSYFYSNTQKIRNEKLIALESESEQPHLNSNDQASSLEQSSTLSLINPFFAREREFSENAIS